MSTTYIQLSQLCEEEEIDGEKLKETKTMINELCDEFVTTLNDCTDSVTGIDKESPLVDTPTISLGKNIVAANITARIYNPRTLIIMRSNKQTTIVDVLNLKFIVMKTIKTIQL